MTGLGSITGQLTRPSVVRPIVSAGYVGGIAIAAGYTAFSAGVVYLAYKVAQSMPNYRFDPVKGPVYTLPAFQGNGIEISFTHTRIVKLPAPSRAVQASAGPARPGGNQLGGIPAALSRGILFLTTALDP